MALFKVEGAGNDFLAAVGDWAERLAGSRRLVVGLCHRQLGLGADGVLLLTSIGHDRLRLDFVNPDGSAAAFCANGTRCAARLAVEHLDTEPVLIVDTGRGPVPATVDGDRVTLQLAAPEEAARQLELAVAGTVLRPWWMRVGGPQLMVRYEDAAELEALDLTARAPELRHHPDLGAEGANVHFVAPCGAGRLAIRSWERGVEGETLACGSGVVAAGLLEMASAGLDRVVCVPRSGQALTVEAVGLPPRCPSRLTGPARVVAVVEPTSRWCSEVAGGTR